MSVVVASAPGRINLIGEHTDYNGGLALPAAVGLRTRVRLERAGELSATSSLGAGRWKPGEAVSGWLRFVEGARAVLEAPPASVSVESHVPLGAGMSSSAALALALLHGFAALQGRALDDDAAIGLAREVEHRFLGVPCGALDQTASQCGRAGHALRIDFEAGTRRLVPATVPGWAWVVVHSGVRRALADGRYAERVRECAAGHPARLAHVGAENVRVDLLIAALEARDPQRIGALLLASHRSLRDDYEVSCTELDQLVAAASAFPGCVGARLMGAGFGGCVLALVRGEQVPDFGARVAPGPWWSVELGDGARVEAA